ncbi:hypothetical protein FA15DRAFT_42915 [Coprinopsis marcescibilis]|uniref:Uncharacterized protein n=1 Tax=Coprinopsis marcescibilis TaxID=230819 RepID=A0A5C3L7Q6_COPMA|nr:hypothetical protein FA15DRAFT_42915 [Coprinopsis marcescibilis]
MTIYVGLQMGSTLRGCEIIFGASAVLVVINMMVAEAIMFIRLYAISGLSKRMGIWLVCQFLGVHVSVLVLFSLFVKSVVFAVSPLRGIPGCLPRRFDSSKLVTVFGLVVASQLAIMLMSTWIGFRKYRASASPILVVFYRDGLFYFVSLAVVTVGNILFDSFGPPELSFMLALPQGVLHSVFSCRLVLHMFEFARKECATPNSEHTKTELRFVPQSQLSRVQQGSISSSDRHLESQPGIYW